LMTPDNDQKLTAHFVLNLTGFLPFKDREALKASHQKSTYLLDKFRFALDKNGPHVVQ
ncbi:hypothetical protein JOC78_003554, partial [Bacillus ectoiniformans]|nr:hypothetical protein [Bacillus ectoiniformans]